MTTPFTNFPIPTTLLSTALSGSLPAAGVPVTYYVSSSGSDTNTGMSTTSPWQTIAKVNASTFNPGDSILFQGGQTFTGAIVSPSSGTPSNPITFGSYGGGQATISSGASAGFSSTNQAGIIVRDLTFIGNGSTNSTNGISFLNNLSGNVHLQNIQIINCAASFYGRDGILINGNNGTAGYDDILIQGCLLTACSFKTAGSSLGTGGIIIASNAGYGGGFSGSASFYNVLISQCYSWNHAGVTDNTWSGNGIVVADISNCLITGCVCWNNGASAYDTNGGGPYGIWCYDATGVIIENCYVYNQNSANGQDGGGYDLDGGTSTCIIRDCLSFSNLGPGYLLWCYNDGTVTESIGNIVQNCVSDSDGYGFKFGVASNTASVKNVEVIDNFTTHSGTASVLIQTASGSTVTGNVSGNRFALSSNVDFIHATVDLTGLIFNENFYQRPVGFSVTWNSTQYLSIYGWNVAAPAQEPSFSLVRGQFIGTYLVANGPSVYSPGLYVGIDGDSSAHQRLVAALTSSDQPFLSMGPGGSSAPDVFLNRQAANVFGVGTTNSNTSGTLAAGALQTTTASVGTAGGSTTPAFVVNSVGGTGQPTTANQNGWLKMVDSTGATIWIPQWK
jgi:hypothetical protein